MDQHTKSALKSYRVELASALILYSVVLIAAISLAFRFESQWMRATLILLPMIPFGIAMLAIYRHLKRMDEYQRQMTLEVIAIASGGTMFFTFAYGFLELIGMPKISMFAVWVLMGVLWIVVNLGRRLAGRNHP